MRKTVLILLSLMITLVSCGQKKHKKKKEKEGHKISFEIKGMENESMLLAYHYNGKHYISDTLQFNEKSVAIMEGKESKPKGVYLAVFPSLKNQYFEFLISDQYFKVINDSEKFGENLRYENSPENVIFTEDMLEMNTLRKESEVLKNDLKAAKGKKKEEITAKLKKLNDDYLQNREDLMVEYPDFFYTDLMGLMKEVKIPEPPKDENGAYIDSSFGWKYWKKHYWDYTDFSEDGILRTPIFYNKLMNFMTKRTEPIQDSIISSCHVVLEKAKANDEVFQYALVTLLNKYANSKIMGDDAVYVDLIETYYKTGQATWTDSAQLYNMIDRANSLSPLIIGKTSPDLTLRDPSLKVKYRLHDLPYDYTIVFVWDHECGHCKKAVPFVKEFYDKYKKDGIMVYAISTVNHEEVDGWKKYIEEKNLNWLNVADPYHETNFRKVYDIASTPQLFILDKNKKIIAKRIGANQLDEFFFNYLKRFDKEKFNKMGITYEAPKDTIE